MSAPVVIEADLPRVTSDGERVRQQMIADGCVRPGVPRLRRVVSRASHPIDEAGLLRAARQIVSTTTPSDFPAVRAQCDPRLLPLFDRLWAAAEARGSARRAEDGTEELEAYHHRKR